MLRIPTIDDLKIDRSESNEAVEIPVVKSELLATRGRGALENPDGRFEKDIHAYDPEADAKLKTEIFPDQSRSIISTNDSPDAPDTTLNSYRGCEHGCIYCFARPYHEYLGMSVGLDFESKIFVKHDGPQLLRAEMMKKSWQPKTVLMSGITDCYQPIEKKLEITRECLKVFNEFKNPVTILTKNKLVTRDIDILAEMAAFQCAQVFVSITTLDNEICRTMEPRASQPRLRLQAVKDLRSAGIPAGVMVAPIIPGLTDHEIPQILEAAAEAGALSAGHTVVRLPYGVKDIFQTWVHEHYPDRSNKILNRIRAMRGGKLYDAKFGTRMRGEGIYAEQIHETFRLYKRKYGLDKGMPPLSVAAFQRPDDSGQMNLF
jgi:DNA repair photolyase